MIWKAVTVPVMSDSMTEIMGLQFEHNRQIRGIIHTVLSTMEKHKEVGKIYPVHALQIFVQFNKSHGIAIV